MNPQTVPITELWKHLESFAGSLCLVALITMALLQAIKEFTSLRGVFQRWWIRNWIASQARQLHFMGLEYRWEGQQPRLYFHAPFTGEKKPDTPSSKYEIFVKRAETSLLNLAAADDASTFYNMPLEQVCGQLSAVAQSALNSPLDHPEFVCAFARPAGIETIRGLLDPERTAQRAPNEANALAGAASFSMQRSIDAIQIGGGASWRKVLRWTAFVCSLTILIVSAYHSVGSVSRIGRLTCVVGAFACAYLASLMRDLVAAFQRLRG